MFLEIQDMLIASTKSEEYPKWLEERVQKALKIAGEDEIQISLLSRRCGIGFKS